MPEFMFALVASLLIGLGGKDYQLVARYAERLGQSFALLFLALIISWVTAFAMAGASFTIAEMLGGAARTMLIAFALVIAAVEMFIPVKPPKLSEPTRSLGALALILAYRQMGDGARLIIFAIAAGVANPWFAALGGALGGSVIVSAAWVSEGGEKYRNAISQFRIFMGAGVLLVGIYMGLKARGVL